ncbi:MAG: hypothetical protein FGM52_12445 [Mycobacterium sp.]|nr:hypothetical protein [Mycobacterium sp.]
MRPRVSRLLTGTAAAVAVILGAGSSAAVHAHGHQDSTPAGPDTARQAAPADPDDRLQALARRATAEARRLGANISLTLLDRSTGRVISSGDQSPFPIASVSKLFIADDLLAQAVRRKKRLSAADRRELDVMLRSSADVPAGEFWKRGGGDAIIRRVADRYNLGSTTVPYDGEWWNTMSTTSNLVRYYELLLNSAGGLPAQQADVILADLGKSTPIAADGYPQRFGIPDGLYAEPVAVKQGWMCCWAPDKQVHLSTGVVGADRRFVIAVAAMQSADEKTARNTLTRIVKTMFPGGRI